MKKKPLIKHLSVIFILSILFMTPNIASSESADESQSKNFRDDFRGQKKRPEWRIENEDQDRYSFVDNEFLLLVTKNPRVNRFVYDTTDLPENFETIIKVNGAPKEGYQGFKLQLLQDNKNQLDLYVANESRSGSAISVNFIKKLRGENSEYSKVFGLGSNISPLILKIHKKGIEYTGFYSIGGGEWKEVGTHIFLNLKGKLNFIAYNWGNRAPAPESAVKVDYFEIKELD